MAKNYFYITLLLCLFSFSGFAQDGKTQASEALGFYPNPVNNGKIYITSKNTLEREILIFDVLGKKVFDVILCNPPYLTNGECIKDGLLGPRIALVAGNRGLGCYEMVAEQVEPFLKPQGVMIVEVGGKRHVDEIRAIFKNLEYVGLRFDLQGRGRCLILKKCATNL